MSIDLNTKSYVQDAFINPNKVLYVGPDHNFSSEDTITLGRTAPKPTATSKGVARSEVRRAKSVTLADGSTGIAVVRIECSFPVGTAQADVDSLRDDVGDFAISAAAGTLMWNHDLTY